MENIKFKGTNKKFDFMRLKTKELANANKKVLLPKNEDSRIKFDVLSQLKKNS